MKNLKEEIHQLEEKLKSLKNESLAILKEELIKETTTLIAGKTFTISHDGMEIVLRLNWEEEDFPSVQIEEIKFIRERTYLEKMLMGTFIDKRTRLEDLEWHPIISKSEPYLEWDRRIKKVCKDSNTTDAVSIDFHTDIMAVAQKRLKHAGL